MSWNVEVHKKLRKILQSLDNYVAYHHFKLFEKCPIWNLYPSTTFLVQPMDMRVNKFEDLCCTKLVNYILEEIKKNVLTSSSAAKEVIARANLLQAAQFIADSCQRVSAKAIPLAVLNTQSWRCPVKSIVKMHIGNYKV
jgi:hypothetical protein